MSIIGELLGGLAKAAGGTAQLAAQATLTTTGAATRLGGEFLKTSDIPLVNSAGVSVVDGANAMMGAASDIGESAWGHSAKSAVASAEMHLGGISADILSLAKGAVKIDGLGQMPSLSPEVQKMEVAGAVAPLPQGMSEHDMRNPFEAPILNFAQAPVKGGMAQGA